jgi:hypothetical protein
MSVIPFCTGQQQGELNPLPYAATSVLLFSFDCHVFLYVGWSVIRVAPNRNWLADSAQVFIKDTFAFVTKLCEMG